DTVIVPLPDKTLPVSSSRLIYCAGDSIIIKIANTQPWVKYAFNSNFNTYWQGNGDTLYMFWGFATNGSYNIVLYAKSNFGCLVTMDNHAIFTGQQLQTAFLASTYSVVAGDSLVFTNQSNGNAYLWSFGNGATIATSTDSFPPPIGYTTVGTSTVQLIASNAGGCIDTFSSNITVVNPVAATVLATCSNGFIDGKYDINDFYVDAKGNTYL